jgi:predicted DNA-binding ribbon-helix-helix protein
LSELDPPSGKPLRAVPTYVAARKYSVTIAGHETSIRIEPPYWDMLVAGAAARSIPVNALIARIDSQRLEATLDSGDSPNLASALRLWALAEAQAGAPKKA